MARTFRRFQPPIRIHSIMQLLSFTIGAEDYAIESRHVIEVLPLVAARPSPRMPDFVRGVFTHRGRLVPLVDLGLLLTDRPLRERLRRASATAALKAGHLGAQRGLPTREQVDGFLRGRAG